MSKPVTNVEIEDILSSIRRLVSEDSPPRPVPVAPQPEAKTDRLVLTPSLRVQETPEADPEPLAQLLKNGSQAQGDSGAEASADAGPILLTNPTPAKAPPAPAEPSDKADSPAETAAAKAADAPRKGPSLLAKLVREEVARAYTRLDETVELKPVRRMPPMSRAGRVRLDGRGDGAGGSETPTPSGALRLDALTKALVDELAQENRADAEANAAWTTVSETPSAEATTSAAPMPSDEPKPADAEPDNGEALLRALIESNLAEAVPQRDTAPEDIAEALPADGTSEAEADVRAEADAFDLTAEFAEAGELADNAPERAFEGEAFAEDGTLAQKIEALEALIRGQSSAEQTEAETAPEDSADEKATIENAEEAPFIEAEETWPEEAVAEIITAFDPAPNEAPNEASNDAEADELEAEADAPELATDESSAAEDEPIDLSALAVELSEAAEDTSEDQGTAPQTEETPEEPQDPPLVLSVVSNEVDEASEAEPNQAMDAPAPVEVATPEPDASDAPAAEPTFHHTPVEESLDWEDVTTDQAAADQWAVPETIEAAPQPTAESVADDVDAPQAEAGVYLDEAALHELVSDIVRQELQGVLGERITRNVRKLVRREIHRVMMTQDFD